MKKSTPSPTPKTPFSHRVKRIGILLAGGIASGLLLTVTVPPISLSLLSYFALLPLFYLLLNDRRNWWWGGWVFEMTYHLSSIHWVSANSGTAPNLAFDSYLAMCLFLGTRASIPFLLAGWVAKRRSTMQGLIFLALLWSGYEWLCSLGELGYPWSINALSLLNWNPALHLVPIGGVWLVGSIMLAANLLFLFAYKHRNWRYAVAALVLIIAPIFIPIPRMGSTKTFRIGVVQPNIDPVGKWADDPIYTVDRVVELSKQILPQKPDLIVFPETAIPFYLQARLGYRQRVQSLIDSLGVPVVSGAQHYERTNDTARTYNAVFVLRTTSAGGIDPEFYAKRWLVPLGERIPFQWLFPSLHGIDLGQAEFTPGPRETPLAVPTQHGELRIGTPVCYESIFPQMARMFARNRMHLLANLTNDGWYEHTWEKPQHAELFRLRALETGVPLIRCANTGISGWIDDRGDWQAQMPEREAMAAVYEIKVPEQVSSRIGSTPWWAIICLIGSIVIGFMPFHRFGLNREKA